MAKEVTGFIKLQIKAGAANPAPPVGPALGSKGLNIMDFCKQFNAATQGAAGKILPVVITVYSDKSFSFEVKQPPVAISIKEAAKVQKGSGEQKEGRIHHLGPGKDDRRRQDARPQCLHSCIRNENGCRNRKEHGYQSHRRIS